VNNAAHTRFERCAEQHARAIYCGGSIPDGTVHYVGNTVQRLPYLNRIEHVALY
jgi:hypothetical protein